MPLQIIDALHVDMLEIGDVYNVHPQYDGNGNLIDSGHKRSQHHFLFRLMRLSNTQGNMHDLFPSNLANNIVSYDVAIVMDETSKVVVSAP